MICNFNFDEHYKIESNKLLEYCIGRGIAAERLFGEKEILLDA